MANLFKNQHRMARLANLLTHHFSIKWQGCEFEKAVYDPKQNEKLPKQRFATYILCKIPRAKGAKKRKLFHLKWSRPWHYTITYLSQSLTFFVLKSGENEEERIILMKSRALRSLDFRIIFPPRPFSWLGVQRWPLWSIWPNWLKLTLYAWFETISDARASRGA